METFDLSAITDQSVDGLTNELIHLRDGDKLVTRDAVIEALGYSQKRYEVTRAQALLLITEAPREAALAALGS